MASGIEKSFIEKQREMLKYLQDVYPHQIDIQNVINEFGKDTELLIKNLKDNTNYINVEPGDKNKLKDWVRINITKNGLDYLEQLEIREIQKQQIIVLDDTNKIYVGIFVITAFLGFGTILYFLCEKSVIIQNNFAHYMIAIIIAVFIIIIVT